jgi:hypothetical protein
MTEAEKVRIEQTNRDMIAEAKQCVPYFSESLKMAAAAGNRQKLQTLLLMADHYRIQLGKYIDLCEEAQNQEIIQLHNYFDENVTDITAALQRKPRKPADEGEDWKQA